MHHTNWTGVVAVALLATACGAATVPKPPSDRVRASDYVPVPFPPRAPPVEIVPPRPPGDVVWADGGWEWEGERYRWVPGAWVVVPEGARRSRWVVVRRREDGQLFFAPSRWHDRDGRELELSPPAPPREREPRTDEPAPRDAQKVED